MVPRTPNAKPSPAQGGIIRGYQLAEMRKAAGISQVILAEVVGRARHGYPRSRMVKCPVSTWCVPT